MKIYILHLTNSGTPESNEILSTWSTMSLAVSALEKALEDMDITPEENNDGDFAYIAQWEVGTELSGSQRRK
jgi:hypothetical protein